MFTAPSYLIDRYVPECEILDLPEKTVAGGQLRWTRGDVRFPGGAGSKRRLLPRPAARDIVADDGVLFDFRRKDPQNWAHFLNNHLPILFAITAAEGLRHEACLVVLPADIPDYIVSVAGLFGLRVLCTDAPVTGTGIAFEVQPWTAVRPERAAWVAQSPADTYLGQAFASASTALPRRAFLARRTTRALENEAEVAAFLEARGYEKIYPEDLSPADQFRLFQTAEALVAIHGAGLAPLLYCPPGAVPATLIELLPCGHMTDVYRVMAQQVGTRWVGVRGRIKPEHIAPAYQLDTPFTRYSLQSFAVDLASLEQAFEAL